MKLRKLTMAYAIDLETKLRSKNHPIPPPICLSFFDGKDSGLFIGNDIKSFLKDILHSSEDIIAHNAAFEGTVICKYFPELASLWHKKLAAGQIICTAITEKLINNLRERPVQQFSLDKLVKFYFKKDISESKIDPDAWRLRYHELENIDLKDWPEEAIRYAIDDSIWAYKVWGRQKPLDMDICLSVEADFWLNWMGLQGILIDKERVLQLEQELTSKLHPKYKALEQAGIAQLSKGKFKKNMKFFRELIEQNIKYIEKTPKGVISTSGESLNKYLAESSAIKQSIQDFIDVIKYEKILTAFVSRLKHANPLMYHEYSAVVSTGRTSSRSTDHFPSVNIQQMPRGVEDVTWDVRNCFIPRKGFIICSIDYSGLELASAAHQLAIITDRTDMRDTINGGNIPVDMHSKLAARIMSIKTNTNIDYDHFTKHKGEPEYKQYRQLSKPINLGFPGGIGYDTMRTLLAKEGIYPKLSILDEKTIPIYRIDELKNFEIARSLLRKEGFPVRIRQIAFDKYQLVYDELVELKWELFRLYPDLEYFLNEYHEKFLNGKSIKLKDEFGIWQNEQLYDYSIKGFIRCNCTYTKICNGILMQSPSAIGAKKATINILKKYYNHQDVRPLAFIHDELLFEIRDDNKMKEFVQDLSHMMIEGMQEVLYSVRIAVEAEVFPYWKKSGGIYSKTFWRDPGPDLTFKEK